MNDLPPSATPAIHDGGSVHRAILESADQGYCTIEVAFDEHEKPVDYRFLEISPAFERQTGIENGLGRWMREIAPDQDQFWFDTYGRVALTGVAERFENFSTPLDRWFSVYALKIDGLARVAVLFDDITDRKRAEAALQASEQSQSFLLELSDALRPLTTPAEIADLAVGRLGEQYGLSRVLFATLRGGRMNVDEHGEILEWLGTASDITQAKAGQEALRESEERQAFLLKLSDALRAESSAEAVADRALQMLSAQMGLHRCYIGIFRLEEDRAEFPHQVHDDRLPPLPAEIRLSDFPKALEVASDRTLVIDNVAEMEGLSDGDRANIQALGVRALITATLRKGENNPLWAIVAGSMHPRVWTRGEVALVEEVAERTWAAVERSRAETVLRESEVRQAFLLDLSDALASLSDPADIQAAAARLVAGQLGVGWCYFNEFDDRGTHATVLGDFHRDGLPSMVGVHDLSGERDFLDLMRSEAMLDMPDLTSSELFSAQGKAAYGALGMRSALGAPLLRSGRLAAVFLVVDTKVRRWARGDAELLRGVAERTWTAIERARAEAARVKAEERFTRLFEASPAPFLVLAPDPARFTITEVNDSYLAATMRTREELVGRALFDAFPDNPNEPNPTGVRKLRASLEHVLVTRMPDKLPGLKYDIPRPDATFEERWWSPVNSPILNENGEVEAIIHNANDVTEERRAEQRLSLLLAELQHRVRNILTMVRSIARRTADNTGDVDDYVRHLDGRLAALARVQTLLTRDPNRGVDLHEMVLDELHNQAALPTHYQIDGPDVELAPKAAEVLSLAVHELATNSTKYGVLSESSGTIRIRWTVDDRDGRAWLRWTWHEPVKATTRRPVRTGFGTELIKNRVPYELRGTGEMRIGDNELEATIDFPLASGASKPTCISPVKDMGQ